MPLAARYVHTNLVAEDWRSLAQFYQQVFGCVPVPPERDFTGPDLDAGTALVGARLRGGHLRLPGLGDDGPTLEVFSYTPQEPRMTAAVNRPGYGHIAFAVDDVTLAQAAVIGAGGRAHGEVVTLTTSDGRRVTWCYVADPEGNLIELQAWS